jgi:hypothetical protein
MVVYYCTMYMLHPRALRSLIYLPNDIGISIRRAMHCSRLVLLEHLGEVPIVQVTAAGLRLLSAHCIQVRLQTLTQS